MFGMWLPVNSEGVPEGLQRLNATNSGMFWTDLEEKLWLFPKCAQALAVFSDTAGGVAYVDVNGDIRDED